MAQQDIQATVLMGGILSAFSRMRSKDFTATFKRLRKPARGDQRDHKVRQAGPRGPWVPLAATTKKRYARQGKRRNRRVLARLPNSMAAKVTSQQLTLKSRVRWSMAHQDGPTIVGRGALLPQRQYMWISSGLVRTARKEFNRAMFRRWLGLTP